MKDGMRSPTWITPLRKPMPAPTASTTGTPSRPEIVAVGAVEHEQR